MCDAVIAHWFISAFSPSEYWTLPSPSPPNIAPDSFAASPLDVSAEGYVRLSRDVSFSSKEAIVRRSGAAIAMLRGVFCTLR